VNGPGPSGMESPEDPTPGPFDIGLGDLRPFALARLPMGQHSLPREFVEANHRNRIMAATISSLAERGYAATTIAHITRGAGVSNTSLYSHYADKEACMLAAYTASVAWLEVGVAAAIDSSARWPVQLREAVAATLALLDADRRLAHLCATEIFCAGAAGQACHRETLDRLAPRLALGRGRRPSAVALAPELEPALIAGAISLIDRRLEDGEEPLTGSAPAITEFLLIPYLGGPAAARAAGGRD
jgi:AcrR family transcriptional regulator